MIIALLVPAAITGWDALQQEGRAPQFTVTTTGFIEGSNQTEPITFTFPDDFHGEVVVLDFMAVNCASCRFVTPRVLAPLEETYGNRTDFEILSIDGWAGRAGETTSTLIGWQEEENAPWPHALDTDGVMQKYSVIALPTLMVIDQDGNIVFNHNGVASKEDVEAAVLAAFEGDASNVQFLQVGLIGLAFFAGLASFFAPCSVGLVPAYMGLLLKEKPGMPHLLRAGLVTAGGIVSLYAVLAVLFWLLADLLLPIVPRLGIAIGILLVLFGILMLIGFDWEWLSKRFGMGKVDGRKGFYMFGLGYGLASFGCTGPIFLPILLAGFARNTSTGLLVMLVYSLAVASFALLAAYLVGAGQQTRLRSILSRTVLITRVAAVLMIAGGAYLIWFDVTAFA
jgi:cytochrome c-type biogenesis protein